MAQGVQDAVVIDGGGDVVGLVFQRIDGITHRNADACLANHGSIVASVAKGYGVAGVEAIVTAIARMPFPLSAPLAVMSVNSGCQRPEML